MRTAELKDLFKRRVKSALAFVTCVVMLAVCSPPSMKADAIADAEIAQAAEGIICSSEGNYGSINANDNGSLSIGKLQWHATRALELLKSIADAAPALSREILGEALYSEVNSASQWETRPVNSSEAAAISALLTTDEGISIQDELAISDITVYVKNGKSLGITDASVLVYFCDINNQHGFGGAKRICASAYETAGSYGGITLAVLHSAALNDIYAGNYPTRRTNVYNYVISLGWTDTVTDFELGVPFPRPDGEIGPSAGSDSDIRWLQTALNVLCLTSLTVNGVFDSETSAALSAFERTNGLSQDGICSRDDINFIASSLISLIKPRIASYYTITTNGANLNMRSGAGTSYSVVTTMPNGAQIGVYAISSGWAHILYNGLEGYCSAEWITLAFSNYITSLCVIATPKTEYSYGEELSSAGLVLKADYYSGDYEYITSGFSLSGSTLTVGTGTVTVTFGGKTTTFAINVADAAASLAVSVLPKTDYIRGEKLQTDGLTLLLTYRSGKTQTIYGGFEAEGSTDTVGQSHVTVRYLGLNAEYDITVHDNIVSIGVNTLPKTEYYIGDAISGSGLILEALHESGITSLVTEGFTLIGSTSSLGAGTVTVDYMGFSTSYDINVSDKIAVINIEALPKTDFYYGDEISTEGLSLLIEWASGKTESVSSGFTVQGSTLSLGLSSVTVGYEGLSTEYNIRVSDKPLSMSIEALPKTDYLAGEELSSEGLMLKVEMLVGGTVYIDSGFTLSGSTLVEGESAVSVAYLGLEAEYTITTTDRIKLIRVETLPKTEYYTDEDFDASGLVLAVEYYINETEYLTEGFEVSGSASKSGSYNCPVNYLGYETSYRITVSDISFTASITAVSADYVTVDFVLWPNQTDYVIWISNDGKNYTAAALVSTDFPETLEQSFFCARGTRSFIKVSTMHDRTSKVLIVNMPDDGDVTLSNTISAYDSLLMLRYSVGLEDLSRQQLELADLNRDNEVDSTDALAVLQYITWSLGSIYDEPIIAEESPDSDEPPPGAEE